MDGDPDKLTSDQAPRWIMRNWTPRAARAYWGFARSERGCLFVIGRERGNWVRGTYGKGSEAGAQCAQCGAALLGPCHQVKDALIPRPRPNDGIEVFFQFHRAKLLQRRLIERGNQRGLHLLQLLTGQVIGRFVNGHRWIGIFVGLGTANTVLTG